MNEIARGQTPHPVTPDPELMEYARELIRRMAEIFSQNSEMCVLVERIFPAASPHEIEDYWISDGFRKVLMRDRASDARHELVTPVSEWAIRLAYQSTMVNPGKPETGPIKPMGIIELHSGAGDPREITYDQQILFHADVPVIRIVTATLPDIVVVDEERKETPSDRSSRGPDRRPRKRG